MRDKADDLLVPIRRIHERIRDGVVEAFQSTDSDELSAVAKEAEGDTIYAVDRIGEKLLVELFEQEIARTAPIVLVSEGLEHGGQVVLPAGTPETDAVWRIIVDPIDGTRGAMYQKRSAWILTGVARNKGSDTKLSDIELAVQTEIPLIKQHLCDVVWASAGKGAQAERWDRLTKKKESLTLRPSGASTIAHGFAMISRFFPGAREELAAIDEEIVRGALGPVRPGKAHCFEDQYICSGGQLYELMSGKDRFVADIRPLMESVLESKGLILGICCHPYDLCTELIAREMGVIVTDEAGRPLRARLNVEDDVSWVGYANEDIRRQIEPLLQKALRDRGLLQESSS
jgi:fructose-1,6-bisphosphatase/inositol monophosphatase family enzyme